MDNLLGIEDLVVNFQSPGGKVAALRGLSMGVRAGQFHALMGESGAGKTLTALSIMRLLQIPPAQIVRGRIVFKDHDLLRLSETVMGNLRGRDISMIFQEPSKYLNPSMTVGEQIMETIVYHLGYSDKAAREKTREILLEVGLPDEEHTMARYPHELSGGMRQRVMIALAIACSPSLLIADEPTTALDARVQKHIVNLLLKIKQTLNTAVLYITHDLGVVKYAADHVSVMYAGRVVESAPKDVLFARPLHPYTRLLFRSTPGPHLRGERLSGLEGTSPDPRNVPQGCSFHPRCPLAQSVCASELPKTSEYGTTHLAACYYAGKEF